jgi:hypothetical protein
VPVLKASGVGSGRDAKADLARDWCMGWPRHVVEKSVCLARERSMVTAAQCEPRSVYT